ncbi:MAG: hypothetical protein N2322_05190, partial [Terrimicrobiaceae bacterium]|nr:hypothetical protein [Terrimicrobiaceae bacterium]
MILPGNLRCWRDPGCLEIGRLPMRASLYSFPTAAAARRMKREESPWFLPLDGKWSFRLAARPEEVAEGDVAPGTDRSGWASIEVPGNWAMQGFDRPHYTNVKMPFAEEPPRVPEANPTGIHVTSFRIPGLWKARRVVAHFGGAESVLMVYVNGRFAGMGKDSRLPSEFDITEHLAPDGLNVLAAVVVKWSDASFIEDQDQWWLGGLHREVFLYSTGPVRIEDAFARAEPEGKHGRLRLDVRAGFSGPPQPGWMAALRVYDPLGRAVFSRPVRESFGAAEPGPNASSRLRGRAVLDLKVPRPVLWSAESPALYK